MRLARHLLGGIAVALLVVSGLGLVMRTDMKMGPAKPGAVEIAGFAFGPVTSTIKVGDKLTWTNRDGTAHTVNSMGTGPLDSGSIDHGKTFTLTFTKPGTFKYYCAFHPFMHGTVTVTG